MLEIIGTSHISSQSIHQIEQAFFSPPDIVAIELDRQRLYGLLHPELKPPSFRQLWKMVGFKGAVFASFGRFIQKKLGKIVGMEPGMDMLSAYNLGKKNNSRVFLIDQPIDITLQNFSKKISFKEKARIVTDLIGGVFGKEKIKMDLSKVPEKEMIRMLIGQLKERYPNIHQVLVADRDIYMADKLAKLIMQFPNSRIVAVVGAGHEEEMARRVKEYVKAAQEELAKKKLEAFQEKEAKISTEQTQG